jgi:DNA-binding MarR family transcriptional regulator
MAAAKKRLVDADYRHLAEFRYFLRLFLSFSEEAARAASLSPQQHQALLAIRGFGGKLTVGELAERLAIKPHSAVGMADRLVEAGLAARQTSARDRRQVVLRLTAAGMRKLAKLSKVHREELKRLAPLLTPLLNELGYRGGSRRRRPAN